MARVNAALTLFLLRPDSYYRNASQLRDDIVAEIMPRSIAQPFIERYKSFMKSRKSPGTREIYRRALDKVLEYDAQIEEKDIRDINSKWVQGLDKHMS